MIDPRYPSSPDDGDDLSPGGQRRREEILTAAIAAAGRRRRGRSAARLAGTVAAVAVIASTIVAVLAPGGRPAPGLVAGRVEPAPRPPAATRDVVPPAPTPPFVARARPAVVEIGRIRTDPTLADRLAVPARAAGIPRLDDDGLMRELRQIGLSGGVVVRDGRPELWWQPVALRGRTLPTGAVRKPI